VDLGWASTTQADRRYLSTIILDFLLTSLNTIIAGILFAILVVSYYFIQKRSGASKGKRAPEAAGGWPLIGHLRLLGGSHELPHITLGALAEKYGPAFTFGLGCIQPW
jgi:hypothetical protein